MLGALEAKVVAQIAEEHRGEWRPIHAGILGILLAHKDRVTHHSKSGRKIMAASCGVSLKTIDRALAQLREWNLIRWESGGILSNGLKVTNQFEFLFPVTDLHKCRSTSASNLEPTSASNLEPTSASNLEPTSASNLEPTSASNLEPTSASQLCRTKQELSKNKAKNLEAWDKLWKQTLEISRSELELELREVAKEKGISDPGYWEVGLFDFSLAFDKSEMDETVSERTVIELAGHVSRKMLDTYSHIRMKSKFEGVMALEKIGPGRRPVTSVTGSNVTGSARIAGDGVS